MGAVKLMEGAPTMLTTNYDVQFLVHHYRHCNKYGSNYRKISLVITWDYRIYDLNKSEYLNTGELRFRQVVQYHGGYYALNLDGDLYYYTKRGLKPRLSGMVEWIGYIGMSGILIKRNGILLAKHSCSDKSRFLPIIGDQITGEIISHRDLIIVTTDDCWKLHIDQFNRIVSTKTNIMTRFNKIVDAIFIAMEIYIIAEVDNVNRLYKIDKWNQLHKINGKYSEDRLSKLYLDERNLLIMTGSGLLFKEDDNEPFEMYPRQIIKI